MDSKRRRKGRRKRWRNSGMRPHRGTARLSCNRRTMAEGVFVPLLVKELWYPLPSCLYSLYIPDPPPAAFSFLFFFFSTLAFTHLYLKICFWPLWVLVVYGLSLVGSCGDCSSLQCTGFSSS